MTKEDYLSSAFLANFLNEGIYLTNGHKIRSQGKNEIQPDEGESLTICAEPEQLTYSGSNNKKVCVIVDYPHHNSIIPKDALILERILASVNLTFDDIALVNHARNNIHPEEIPSRIETEKLIAFGVRNMKGYNQVQFSKHLKALYIPDNLTTLAMSREKKVLLWQNLKVMFNI